MLLDRFALPSAYFVVVSIYLEELTRDKARDNGYHSFGGQPLSPPARGASVQPNDMGCHDRRPHASERKEEGITEK
jgi:hypothetical protein